MKINFFPADDKEEIEGGALTVWKLGRYSYCLYFVDNINVAEKE